MPYSLEIIILRNQTIFLRLNYSIPGGVKYDISVIIPTYNRTDYFERTLQSVLNQDYDGPYEILVVDNYDKDGESPILHVLFKYSSRSNIVYYHNQKNLGMLGNWNRGIQLASAEYITYCHDDDILLPNCLSRLLFLQKKSGNKCILSKYNIIDEEGVMKKQYSYPHSLLGLFKERDSYSYTLYDQFISSMGFGVGCLFNKYCMMDLGGYNIDFYPSADYALQICYTYNYGCIVNNVPTFNYRIGRNESLNVYESFAEKDRYFRDCMMSKMKIPQWILRIVNMSLYRISKISIAVKWGSENASSLKKIRISDKIIVKLFSIAHIIKAYRL